MDIGQPRRGTEMYRQEFRGSGGRVPVSEGEWILIAKTAVGTRIDYTIVASTFQVAGARYVAGCYVPELASPKHVDAVSDHANLVIDLAAGAG